MPDFACSNGEPTSRPRHLSFPPPAVGPRLAGECPHLAGQAPRRCHRLERAADRQRGGGEHRRRVLKQPAAQQPCHRKRCHPQHRAYAALGCPRWSASTTSVRSGMAGTNADRMRVAVSLMSLSAVTASARVDAAFGSLGAVSIAERALLAASRSAVR